MLNLKSLEMLISVIISTYNHPLWLDKVLYGYTQQSDKNIEIVIADDGSGKETLEVIEKYSTILNLKHVWHEDNGFQKCAILNKAIVASSGEYLLFSDGDCIPRADFVATHRAYSQKGYFLSGGAFRLTDSASQAISYEDIKSQKSFNIPYLKTIGQRSSFFKNLKCSAPKKIAKILNAITPAKATWNGGNASTWREDILAVGGYDERMKYGGEDRELGERLFNRGLKSKQIRYSAICIHLEHPRGYVNKEDWENNYRIRETTKKEKRTFTEHGITNKSSLNSK